jgi:hypothetical protein
MDMDIDQPITQRTLPISYSDMQRSEAPVTRRLPQKNYILHLRSWDTRVVSVAGGVFTFNVKLPQNLFKKAPKLRVMKLVIRNIDAGGLFTECVCLHCRDIFQQESFSTFNCGQSDILLTFQGYEASQDMATTSVAPVIPLSTLNNQTLSFYFSSPTQIYSVWLLPFSLTIALTEDYD